MQTYTYISPDMSTHRYHICVCNMCRKHSFNRHMQMRMQIHIHECIAHAYKKPQTQQACASRLSFDPSLFQTRTTKPRTSDPKL